MTAAQLHRRGREALNAGRHAEARRLLSSALSRAPDVDTRARCLLSLALIAAERGNHVEGLRLCHEALALPALSIPVRGLAASQIGLLQMRAGRTTEALSAFGRAEPLLTDDRPALARLHLNRGNIHLQQLRPAAAVVDFQRARELTTDPVEAAKAEHNLGYAEYLRGNHVEALRMMERADPVLDPLSPFLRAVNESDRAEVLSACGMPEQASAALERAAHSFALRRLRQSQGEAELARARILQVHDPARAAPVARRAARRFRLRGSLEWALRADAVALGAEITTGRRPRQVSAQAGELHRELSAHGLRAEGRVAALYAARAALALGDHDQARAWVTTARVGRSDPLPTRLLDREMRAELAARSGRPAAAWGHLRRGLDDLHEWLSAFGSLDLQSSLVGHGRSLAALGLDLAVRDGRPDRVFEWSERARVLVTRVAPVQAPPAGTGQAELAELRRLQQLGADTTELRDLIRRHAWYAPAIGRSARPVSLEVAQQALGGAALLTLVVAGDRLTALVVTADGARVAPLGSARGVLDRLPGLAADLDMASADLPTAIAGVVRHSLDDQLGLLGERLIRPVEALVGDRRMVVVPAGSLGAVPWTLLPALRGRPVTVARSATHWVTDQARSGRAGRAGFVSGPDVPRAAEEVRRSAAAWGSGSAVVALDAAADRVSQVASQVDVLHVAAHGRHSADHPLFSGIELSGGPWFGYDVDQLAAVPSVVLLSSCELGRSTVRGHEELVGMTTAWLHAGSRCVLASPAAVNDGVACELLPRVHRRLVAGLSPAEALAEATTEVDGLAAFACYGSGW